jgi:hypothetical protein
VRWLRCSRTEELIENGQGVLAPAGFKGQGGEARDARGPVNIVEPLVHGDGQDILLVVAQGSQSVQVGLNVEGAAGASHGEVADPQLLDGLARSFTGGLEQLMAGMGVGHGAVGRGVRSPSGRNSG